MKMIENYLINEKTVLLTGVYHKNGELFTEVIEGDDIFLVTMSPIKLIDKSLLQYGSSFKGAILSSKELLLPLRMYPIKISGQLDIWIFPTRSYNQEKCVWFVLNHIHDTLPKGIGKTKILLSYGHTFTIDMRESSFRNKRRNAEDLRDKITKNTKNSLTFLLEPEKGFQITELKGGYRYRSMKKE